MTHYKQTERFHAVPLPFVLSEVVWSPSFQAVERGGWPTIPRSRRTRARQQVTPTYTLVRFPSATAAS